MPNQAILISSDTLGAPDAKLGAILISNFLRNLGDRESLPDYIVLWNGGVKLATQGTETLDHLKTLEKRGVRIVSCRTCVEYFGIEEKILAGEIDGMVRILDILANHNVLTV